MARRIAVGLLGPGGHPGVAGWRSFLIREGIPWVENDPTCPVVVAVGEDAAPRPAPESVLIVDGALPPGTPRVRTAVQRLLAHGDSVRVQGVADLPLEAGESGSLSLLPFVGEGGGRPTPGYPVYLVRDRTFYLPLALGEQLVCAGSGFFPYGPDDDDEPERVEMLLAAVDRNGVCRVLQEIVRTAFARSHVPLVRKWYYPRPCSSILLARFDVDVLVADSLQLALATGKAHGRRATFFVNTSGEEETEDSHGVGHATDRVIRQAEVLRTAARQGNEVASHGHWHTVFPHVAAARQDLGRSLDLLRQLGLACRGYGGPGGVWYPALPVVLEQLALSYSSELGCGFDGFPFWPGTEADRAAPVHVPVCPFLQVELARRRPLVPLLAGWRELVRCTQMRGEPVSFILHLEDLTEHGPELYDGLLSVADEQGLEDVTFSEWVDWWRRRAAIELDATWNGKGVEVEVSSPLPLKINDQLVECKDGALRGAFPIPAPESLPPHPARAV